MSLNRESRTANASKNTVAAFADKIIVLLLTFISRKLFIQYIGIEYLGINALFANILTMLSIADFGIGTAMNVSLYKPIAQNDTEKLSALLHYFRKLYWIIAIGIAMIGTALVPFLKCMINMEQDIPYLELYYMVFVINSSLSYLFVYKSSIIAADQKNYITNKIGIYVNIAKIIIQTCMIILLQNYLVYILAEVLITLANNLIISYVADRNYPFIKERAALGKEEKTSIFRDIHSVFLYKIAWSLLNGTDNILMSMLVGTIFVGMYSNYYSNTHNLEAFIGLLFTSLTASIGNLVATSTKKHQYKIFRVMQMVSFWIGGISTVYILFLLQDFIQLWLGKEMLLDNIVMIAIALNSFFSNCMRPVWTFREATGMYRNIKYIMLITAVINLILSLVLGKLLGLSGILFATSISKLCTYFWYEPNILFRKFFCQSSAEYYFSFLFNTLLLVICIGACGTLVGFFEEVSIFTFFCKTILCSCITCLSYFLRYRKTEEFSFIRNKVSILFLKR